MKDWRDRFEEKVDRSGGPDACHLWTAGCFWHGYGQFRRGPRTLYAHRVAFELENGPVPEALCVCHLCDNRRCVNPRHLWLGTNAENNADRDAKGRTVIVRGERSGMAKLSRPSVAMIRVLAESGLRHRDIADSVGVSRSTVSKVLRGELWSDS